jgi:hypothetical protein
MERIVNPRFFVHVALLAALCGSASVASAATLSFGSGSGSVGQTISVPVYVSAEGSESLNGVSARIDYPTDKLSLLSISKAGSVIAFWAEEPNFSNSAGTASIEGIIPNPGYSGRSGRVVTLVFQVKAPGSATLSFGRASVLANDGRGTNILSSAPSRSLTLSAAAPTPVSEPVRPAPREPVRTPTPEQPVVARSAATPVASTTATAEGIATGTASSVPEISGIFYESPPPTAVRLGRVLVFVLAALGLLGLLLAAYLLVRRVMYQERLRRVASHDVVHRSFSLLRKDLSKHIRELKRLPDSALTEQEIGFLDQFEKDLTEAEKIVESRTRKGG